MDGKVITQVDSNLITFKNENIDEKSILKNELLIKELVNSINNNELFISADDQKALSEYQKLKELVDKLLKATETTNLNEVIEVINKLAKKNNQKNQQLKQLNQEKEQVEQELQQELQKLKVERDKLQVERDKFKRQYEGQKNRKVIRLMDKVSR